MADSKLTDLPAASALAAADVMYVAQSGTSAKCTVAQLHANAINGAASTPPQSVIGTWFTGGSSTTTKPQVLVEPAGTTSTGWSTAGTGIGVNAASGFAGNLFDGKVNGTSLVTINSNGQVLAPGSGSFPGLRFMTHNTGFRFNGASDAGYIAVYINSNDRWALADSGPRLGTSATVTWQSSGFGSAQSDAGLARNAANVVRVTNGSTGIGSLLTAKLVEANAAGSGSPNILAVTESRTVFTNEGATAQNYHTLPSAVAGLEFEFAVQDSDGIRIVANTGDTIRDVATVSSAAGYIQSTTVGSTLRLLAINATEWIAISKQGTWTIDS